MSNMHTSLQGKLITQQQIIEIARAHGFEYAALRAVIMVEGSGRGFDTETGKILIQFEPKWYRRIDAVDGFSGGGSWEENQVEKQPGEWKAFNDAFAKDKDAAMQATSIGMMQVMGFHFRDLGFATVGEMWDFAKESEANQIELGVRFIKKSMRLTDALRTHDWKTFAYHYNGKNYKENNYDVRLATHYNEATNTTA